MTKHTQGPWEPARQGGDGSGTIRVRQAKPIHPDAEWLWVARDVRTVDDARLIAAAPELLAALVAIVANAELAPDQRMDGATDAYSIPTDDIGAARAAIAKAEEG